MRSALSAVVAALVVCSVVAVSPAAAAVAEPADATTDESPSTADAAAATDAGAASDHDACTQFSNGTAPENPDGDQLGWENGCWYNESIEVDRSNGLNDTELDAVVARGMARVEQIRELEFERTVPVQIISREQFQANTSYNSTVNNTLHQNVKWEAMLMVGEDTDAISVQESNTGSTVGGYYSPSEERIVIVSENTTSPKMNEITLSQELFHALQDQRYNISAFDQSTQELHNAKDGIIEGDGNLVDQFYEERCTTEWDCLMPQPSQGGGGGSSSIHFGMYLVTFQPYSDGPKFVDQIYKSEGWEGVNAVYETPPQSTEQTIHPEKYDVDEPADVTVRDTSSDEWRVPHIENGTVDYAEFGEAGLAAMLFYPFYHSDRSQTPVVSTSSFFNFTPGGQLSSYDPVNYTTKYTDGWDGDKLYPYVTDDSAETNETGYVWKTVWDSEKDAAEFVEGYSMLLEYYGAESVSDRANTYRLPDGELQDAIYVNHTGTTVTLVNAPTVEELSDLRAGAAPEGKSTETATDGSATDEPAQTEEPTPTETAMPTEESTETDASSDGDMDGGEATETATPTTSTDGPGLGIAVALVALVLGALALRRRE